MNCQAKFMDARTAIAVQVAVVILLVALFSLPAFSQLNLGRILGNVTDSTGGVIAGAKVTVTDQDRGASRALTSDETGAFAAPSLTPGNYTVRVEAAGFNISERRDVQVQVGSDARVDIVLQAGSQTQTVTVTEAVPLINTTSATLGGVVEGRDFTSLPVVGRSYQSLLQFQPGVVTRPGGGSAGHSSNGLRTDGNNWLFEGIFSGGVRTAGSIINTNSNTGDGASVVPPDAIQEFNVSFQNKAEYGWKPGVASNVGLKSGTNSIHGTAFAVGQTSMLNARNPFNPAPRPKPLLAYQQYGATIGGAIRKDKLFYYVAYEGMEFTQGVPTTHTSATTAMIAGDAANSIPAAYLDMVAKSQIAAAAIDASGKVVNSALLTPAQQLSAALVGAGVFQTGLPTSGSNVYNFGFTALRDPNKNIIGKIDYHIGDKNQISGEYFWNRDTEIGNSDNVLQPYWFTDYYLTGNVARANWTYLPTSNWVNEFHFGFDRKIENSWPAECNPGRAAAPPKYGINTGAATPCLGFNSPTNFAFPITTIGSFDPLGAGTTQQRRVEGYPAVVDNVSHTTGNHNIKFGIEIRRPYFSGANYTNVRGAVSFGTSNVSAFATTTKTTNDTIATPLEDFLDGVPSTGTYFFGDPSVLVRSTNIGTFFQDDWRLTPRLTLNLGLRYEYETPLSEASNKLSQFDPNLGLVQLGHGLDSIWKPHFLGENLQPRLGVVYDVTGKGTTVVRAAFGIYSNWPVWQVFINNAPLQSNPTAGTYYGVNGATSQGTGTVNSAAIAFPTGGGTVNSTTKAFTAPSPLLNWTSAGPVFPTGSLKCGNGLAPVNPVAGAPTTNPGTCSIASIDQHWRLPYVDEWTLGIQRSLTSAMSLDVAYVGNHGSNLLNEYDLNIPTPGPASKSAEQTSRPYYMTFPWMGKIIQVANKDHSNYNALQATLNQRNWHGLTSTVGYTYGHALDVTQADINMSVNPNAQCPECDYGPTSFDIRHRVTARATYLVPGKKSFGQILEGWQVSTLVNMIGAISYNGSDSSSDLSGTGEGTTAGFGDRWDLFGNIKDFNTFGRTAPIPCYGVTGSSFANPACTVVANVNLMPQPCINAANSLPTNPNVPSSDGKSTGIKSLGALGCYMAGNSVIVPPAQGTFGNMNRNMFRGAGLRLWDLSLRKKIRITERVGSEFQFDMYNVTNTPQFASPSGSGASLTNPGVFGTSAATPNVANGNVVQGTGEARRYQFGLKFIF